MDNAPQVGNPFVSVSELSDNYNNELFVFNNQLIFPTRDASNVLTLMAFDNINNTVNNLSEIEYLPNKYTVYDNELFYSSSNKTQLRFLDIENKTEQIVADFGNDYQMINSANMIVYNNKLYFTVSSLNGSSGIELWQFDSETNLVSQVSNTEGNQFGYYQHLNLSVYKNQLFFSAYDQEHGLELWQYDSEQETTQLMLDILLGFRSAEPQLMTLFDNALWGFAAVDFNPQHSALELVKFTVNRAPEIEVGIYNTQVQEGDFVTVNINATDSDKDDLIYTWRQTSGTSTIDLTNSNSELNFNAPQVKVDETYRFELTVSDGMEVT